MLKSQDTSAQKIISKDEGQGGEAWSEAVTASLGEDRHPVSPGHAGWDRWSCPL